MSEFMTVKEAAAILRVSKMTIYRMLETGEIESVRVGHLFRIPTAAFEAYLVKIAGQP